MKLIRPSLLLVLILFSCSKSNFDKDVAIIKDIMYKQSQCWSNGDIDGYMNGYWESDSLRFLGSKGLVKGWQMTLDNYKKSYPSTAAMGTLKFTNISFEQLNYDKIFVVGKWELYREKDTLQGHYSLVWQKIDDNWKIIFDHSD